MLSQISLHLSLQKGGLLDGAEAPRVYGGSALGSRTRNSRPDSNTSDGQLASEQILVEKVVSAVAKVPSELAWLEHHRP